MAESQQKALLPQGLVDYLPEEAERLEQVRSQLLTHFSTFGYRRVAPPMIEYEQGLFAEPSTSINPNHPAFTDETLSRQSFRVMDPVSQRMMAIRCDITGQIGRLADTRLKDYPRPLRLSYGGTVLRVRGDSLQPLRQLTQIGCEYFGDVNALADAEVIALALSSLYRLGVKRTGLDLTLPGLVPALLETIDCEASLKQDIRHALAQKDGSTVKAIFPVGHEAHLKTLLSLLEVNGAALNGFERLRDISKDLSKPVATIIPELEAIYHHLVTLLPSEMMKNTTVTLDLTDHRGFSYHNGVAFQIFAEHLRNELGRGGRYLTAHDGQAGTGFSLYLEELLRILPPTKPAKQLLIPTDLDTKKIDDFIQQGFNIVRAISPIEATLMGEAKRLGLSHTIDNKGTIIAIN